MRPLALAFPLRCLVRVFATYFLPRVFLTSSFLLFLPFLPSPCLFPLAYCILAAFFPSFVFFLLPSFSFRSQTSLLSLSFALTRRGGQSVGGARRARGSCYSEHSARQLGCVTRIGARNPRSTCCDAEGPGPGDIHIRLVRHFMCRLYVLQEPHPAVSGQLEVFLNGQLGQIPPVAQTSISLCPARACHQLTTPHMKREGQRETAEAKKEG